MSAFIDLNKFWIIFDTCTKPFYSQDLYNLLAHPRDSVLRYEYRRRYLSGGALEAALLPGNAPSQILFVYAQWKQYRRGDNNPTENTPLDEIEWIPTRLGKMLLIPPPDGEAFYFDFKVLGYPKVNKSKLLEILSPHISQKEVPYNKWVCISDNVQELEAISVGTDSDNWQAIINELCTPPMQFTHDTFWRLSVPQYARRSVKHLRVEYEPQRALIEGRSEIRQYIPYYLLSEGRSCQIELISYKPSERDLGVYSPMGKSKVDILIEENSPISVENKVIHLRHYTAEFIKISTKRSESLDPTVGLTEFRTVNHNNEWPGAPNLKLRFRIQKQSWRIYLAALLLPATPAATFLADRLWDTNQSIAIILLALASVFPVLAALLYLGRIKLK
jgi:hypothetical protein